MTLLFILITFLQEMQQLSCVRILISAYITAYYSSPHCSIMRPWFSMKVPVMEKII